MGCTSDPESIAGAEREPSGSERWSQRRELFLAVIEALSDQRRSPLPSGSKTMAAEIIGKSRTDPVTSAVGDKRDHWRDAALSAADDEEAKALIAWRFESEAVDLAQMVEEGKTSGAVDPSLSTNAVVLLLQSLSTGMSLMRQSPLNRVRLPPEHELDALLTRVFSALGPR